MPVTGTTKDETLITAGRHKAVKPFKNDFFCHSWLDPESKNFLIMLDSRFRGNDNIEARTELIKAARTLRSAIAQLKLRTTLVVIK